MIAPLDIMYHVGNFIYRRSARYMLFTAGLGLLGLVFTEIGLPGLTWEQAVLLPIAIGACTMLGGTLLKMIPRLISARLLVVAQASDLNLMKDYRKAQREEHLEILWQRIYRVEAELALAAKKQPFPDEDASDPATPAPQDNMTLEDAHQRFLARARLALASHLPQGTQHARFGIDLHFFEDWRDGAYFDRSDSKIPEQFAGSATLYGARKHVHMTGLGLLRRQLRPLMRKLWFAILARWLAMRTADAIQALNRRYDTDQFNSQVFLWPGEENATWLEPFPGARDEVLRQRKRILYKVLGASQRTIFAMVQRILVADGLLAAELRMRYDPDYGQAFPVEDSHEESVAQAKSNTRETRKTRNTRETLLGYTILDDLEQDTITRCNRQQFRVFAHTAASRQETLEAYLQSQHPELYDPKEYQTLRALRIAYHVNARNFQKRLRRGQPVERTFRQIVAQAPRINHRLLAVRLHHELTRLQRAGYVQLVADLYQSLPNDAT